MLEVTYHAGTPRPRPWEGVTRHHVKFWMVRTILSSGAVGKCPGTKGTGMGGIFRRAFDLRLSFGPGFSYGLITGLGWMFLLGFLRVWGICLVGFLQQLLVSFSLSSLVSFNASGGGMGRRWAQAEEN